MVSETKDRELNIDSKIQNDGVKRLPHERDEAPDGQQHPVRGVMKQAADDLEQGLVDTDLHGERGIEQTVANGHAPGQAHPHDDAGNGMRDHTAATDRTKK
jgi:hypothetical protein